MNFLSRETFTAAYEGKEVDLPERKGREEFIHKILGSEYMPLADFDEAFSNVLKSLSSVEQEVLKSRVLEEKSFNDIGQQMNLTGERVRQIEKTAIRKCVHPSRRGPFKYGIRILDELKQKQEKLKELKVQIELLEQQEEVIKEKYINKMNACLSSLEETSTQNGNKEIAIASPQDRLMKSIESLNLSVRSYNALKRAGVESISQLIDLMPKQLIRIPNLGSKSMSELVEVMTAAGYSAWANEVLQYIRIGKDKDYVDSLLFEEE